MSIQFFGDAVRMWASVISFLASVDFDEIQHYAAFHHGLHCLPKCALEVTSIQRDKKNLG